MIELVDMESGAVVASGTEEEVAAAAVEAERAREAEEAEALKAAEEAGEEHEPRPPFALRGDYDAKRYNAAYREAAGLEAG